MKINIKRPPKVLEWILERFLRYEDYEAVLGDFEEKYSTNVHSKGIVIGFIWYVFQIMISMPKFIKSAVIWSLIMFKNYMKITLRNIKKQKGYSFLNITGLAVGIACFILIMLFVRDELKYDKFHEKADRIFRVYSEGQIGDTDFTMLASSAILNRALRAEYPEILTVTTMTERDNYLVEYENRIFREDRIILTDTTFFDVFTFPFIQGNPDNALSQPYSVVLTRSTSDKYFGGANPLGKTLSIDNNDYVVTGVVEDVPVNSHFHFDFLLSLTSFGEIYYNTNFTQNIFITYLVLQDGIAHEQLHKKFPDFVKKHIYSESEAFWSGGNFWEYYLQPLTEIHLNPDPNGESQAQANVYIFSVIAVFILIIACINFMNLTTSLSANRAKEVGIRKVAGSFRAQLVQQFMSESIVLSFISLCLALIIVELLLPAYRNFVGKQLEIPYSNPFVIAGLTGVALLVSLLSGAYPAFFLASFKPVSVLKGKLQGGSRHSILRNGLVIFQFSISIFLIISTFVVFNQLEFIRNSKLGFTKEQVVVIHNPLFLGDRINVFKETLLLKPEIPHVSLSHTLPGRRHNNWGCTPEGQRRITLHVCLTDEEFIETMNIKMVKGRYFSKEFKSDSTAVVLNENAARLLNWYDDPLGKTMKLRTGITWNVIGVVKDYNFQSIREEINPLILVNIASGLEDVRYITARINTGNVLDILEYIEKTWKSFAPGMPYEFSFLDEDYDNLYRNEKQTGDIFTLFSFLAVFIASLGLFGLASFMAKQRTREVGIRKALGASEINILRKFSGEFLFLVMIANTISWPVAWFAMNGWLQKFAYRVDIGIEIFLISSTIAILFAVLAVSYQSIKAAKANPVEALRCE